MIGGLLKLLATAFAAMAIICYVQYARHRMKGNEQKEAVYLRLHYLALVLLCAVGIAFMFYMGAYSD